MTLPCATKQSIVVEYFVFVAQLDSASDSDSEGRGFESRQTQIKRSPETGFFFCLEQVLVCLSCFRSERQSESGPQRELRA